MRATIQFFFVAAVFLLAASPAYAYTIVQQTATTAPSILAPYITVGEFRYVEQSLGSGFSSTATSTAIYVESGSGLTSTSISLDEYSDSDYTTLLNRYQSATTTSNATGWIVYDHSDVTFSPLRFYKIRYNALYAFAGSRNWKGTSADVYPAGSALAGTGQLISTSDGSFILYGFNDTSSRVIETSVSPSQGSIVPSTVVSVSFDFYSGSPTIDRVGYELQDLTSSLPLTPKETSVLSSGLLSFSTTTVLLEAHTYALRPYVLVSATQQKNYGPSRIFSVVSQGNQFSTQYENDFTGYGFFAGASSSTINAYGVCDEYPWPVGDGCSFVLWLVVPSNQSAAQWQEMTQVLRTRAPFVYGYELATFVQSAQVVASSTVLHVDLMGEDLVLLDFDTVVSSYPLIATIRNFVAYGLYFFIALYLITRVRRIL